MSTLAVELHQARVGVLDYYEEDERYLFHFDETWLQDPDRPTLGQLFLDRMPHPIEYSGPPCWFSHLLPQGPLRRAICRASSLSELDEFALYALLGDDLPGAVVLRPIESPVRRPTHRATVAGMAVTPWSALSGMQLKISFRKRERGLVVGARGEERDWIAKFESPDHRGLPRVEFATMSWAKAAGIDVPAFELTRASRFEGLPDGLTAREDDVFILSRLYRPAGGHRVHFEDFAQVLDRPLDGSIYIGRYETLAAVIQELCPDELLRFVRRVTFCALAGNGDAHLKNWALLYPDGKRPILTPAYDLVSTVAYPPEVVDDQMALTLAGSRAFEDVRASSFAPLAQVCGVAEDLVTTCAQQMGARVRECWESEGIQELYSKEERTRIEAHLRRVSLE